LGLIKRIRAYQPLAIVSVMRGIGNIVNEVAIAAGSDSPRYVVPFPGNGQQRCFLDAMARIMQRGFGFITTDDGHDHFVHFRALLDGRAALQQDQRVEFDIETQADGCTRAKQVRVIEWRGDIQWASLFQDYQRITT